MNAIVCVHCNAKNRVTKPVMVPYIDLRSSERHCFWACWFCDVTDSWPNFAKQSPPIPKE